MTTSIAMEKTRRSRRVFWLKQLHTWHWVSSAACLVGMLLFAVTGITLNHAGEIESSPEVATREVHLPAAMAEQIAGPRAANAPLPTELAEWIEQQLSARVRGRAAEWSESEAYVALPRPGGDAWLSVERKTGLITYEVTDRGWIAYLNDLHKARDTGIAWRWFIDVFAVACVVFCLTGMLLLQRHAGNRPATWPIVGTGFVVPFLLAALLVH